MLGQEDVILQRNYTTSVVCLSTSGSLYYIEKKDFLSKMQKKDVVWDKILNFSQNSNQAIISKIKKAVNKNQQIADYFDFVKLK